tara:strand:- start:3757 stop:3966 length:210 start_codon:yes stop_codon:yes gene_type:complete
MFKAKVRITANEIRKVVEEFIRPIRLDLRRNKNEIQSVRKKVLKCERLIKELQEEYVTCRGKKVKIKDL